MVPAEIFATANPVPAHDPASMQTDDSDLALPDSAHLWPGRSEAGDAHRAEMAAVREMPLVAVASSAGIDLPDSIEIDPLPAAREKPAEAPKPPKVTLFPIPSRPTAPPPTRLDSRS